VADSRSLPGTSAAALVEFTPSGRAEEPDLSASAFGLDRGRSAWVDPIWVMNKEEVWGAIATLLRPCLKLQNKCRQSPRWPKRCDQS
jgi:hypothetical protein